MMQDIKINGGADQSVLIVSRSGEVLMETYSDQHGRHWTRLDHIAAMMGVKDECPGEALEHIDIVYAEVQSRLGGEGDGLPVPGRMKRALISLYQVQDFVLGMAESGDVLGADAVMVDAITRFVVSSGEIDPGFYELFGSDFTLPGGFFVDFDMYADSIELASELLETSGNSDEDAVHAAAERLSCLWLALVSQMLDLGRMLSHPFVMAMALTEIVGGKS